MTAHAGLSPLRALQRPRLLGTGYPILSPELGLFVRAYPTAFVGQRLDPDSEATGSVETADSTRAGGEPLQEGLRSFSSLDEAGVAYWAWGPELRVNVAGLLSASVNVPIFPDMTLQKFVVTNRFTAVFTLPIGSHRARPPHWEGDRRVPSAP